MSFGEQRSILEVQDYLVQNLKNVDEVCAELVGIGLITPSELDLFVSHVVIKFEWVGVRESISLIVLSQE